MVILYIPNLPEFTRPHSILWIVTVHFAFIMTQQALNSPEIRNIKLIVIMQSGLVTVQIVYI